MYSVQLTRSLHCLCCGWFSKEDFRLMFCQQSLWIETKHAQNAGKNTHSQSMSNHELSGMQTKQWQTWQTRQTWTWWTWSWHVMVRCRCCSVGSSPDRSMQIAMTSCSDSSDSASGASGASAAVAASVDAAGADGAGGASVPNVLTVPRVCECPWSMKLMKSTWIGMRLKSANKCNNLLCVPHYPSGFCHAFPFHDLGPSEPALPTPAIRYPARLRDCTPGICLR